VIEILNKAIASAEGSKWWRGSPKSAASRSDDAGEFGKLIADETEKWASGGIRRGVGD